MEPDGKLGESRGGPGGGGGVLLYPYPSRWPVSGARYLLASLGLGLGGRNRPSDRDLCKSGETRAAAAGGTPAGRRGPLPWPDGVILRPRSDGCDDYDLLIGDALSGEAGVSPDLPSLQSWGVACGSDTSAFLGSGTPMSTNPPNLSAWGKDTDTGTGTGIGCPSRALLASSRAAALPIKIARYSAAARNEDTGTVPRELRWVGLLR